MLLQLIWSLYNITTITTSRYTTSVKGLIICVIVDMMLIKHSYYGSSEMISVFHCLDAVCSDWLRVDFRSNPGKKQRNLFYTYTFHNYYYSLLILQYSN